MMKVLLAIALVLVPTALCQVNVGVCNGRWSQYVTCLKNGVIAQAKNDRQFPMPDQSTQNRLKKAVENCFTQQGCQSPVPTNQETNARRDCFKQQKRALDSQLNQCVDSQIRGWNPPNDYARIELDEWGYTVARVYDAVRSPRQYCGRVDGRTTQQLTQCVRRDANINGYDFERKTPRSLPSYWCQEDARCWDLTDSTNNGRDQCQQNWNRNVQPALCQCVRRRGLDQYVADAKQKYDACLNNRVSTQITRDEPGDIWIDEYIRSLCGDNQCKSERSRFESRYDNRGGNNGNNGNRWGGDNRNDNRNGGNQWGGDNRWNG